jgi:hypothetical protein
MSSANVAYVSDGPPDSAVALGPRPTEARDRAGRYFRLEDCLDALRRTDLEAAADELLERLRAHTGRKLDDNVAVLLLEATSPSARPEDESAATAAPACDCLPDADPLAAGCGFPSRAAAQSGDDAGVRCEPRRTSDGGQGAGLRTDRERQARISATPPGRSPLVAQSATDEFHAVCRSSPRGSAPIGAGGRRGRE